MTKPVLLLNCGSSSIKYQMIDVDTEDVMATGLVQRIGQSGGTIDHEVHGAEHHRDVDFADHEAALAVVVEMFDEYGPALRDAIAVGHRTVHGGETFKSTTVIDQAVIDKLVELSPLAPLHNPPGIAGIKAAMHVLADVPHVAIFDTAFFADLPAEAYTYAIPTDLAHQHHIRRYGFHGTSHSYVSHKTAAVLGRPYDSFKQIVCHLGNGASISGIVGGRPVETSMGLTPLQGLVMGTRSGDVDPGLHAFLARQVGMSIDEVDNLLNKQSGMVGLAGVSDFRDIDRLIGEGDEAAQLALDVYVHRLVSYIGAYAAVLGGLDALTFTAGVGENSDFVRKAVGDRLAGFGVLLGAEANKVRSKEPRVISTPHSRVVVLVVPTNEELAMARETAAAIA